MPAPWQILHDDVLLAYGKGVKEFIETAPEVVSVLEAGNMTEDAGHLRNLVLTYEEDEGD